MAHNLFNFLFYDNINVISGGFCEFTHLRCSQRQEVLSNEKTPDSHIKPHNLRSGEQTQRNSKQELSDITGQDFSGTIQARS